MLGRTNAGGGSKINGVVEQYTVAAGETIKKGDWVSITPTITQLQGETTLIADTTINVSASGARNGGSESVYGNRIFHIGVCYSSNDYRSYYSAYDITAEGGITLVASKIDTSYISGRSDCTICAVSDTDAIIADYCTGPGTSKIMLVRITGNSFTTIATLSNVYMGICPKFLKLTDGKLLLTSQGYSTVVQYTTSTITKGNNLGVGPASGYEYLSIRLSESQAMIVSGGYAVQCLNISGTAVSAGTSYNLNLYTNYLISGLIPCDDTNVICLRSTATTTTINNLSTQRLHIQDSAVSEEKYISFLTNGGAAQLFTRRSFERLKETSLYATTGSSNKIVPMAINYAGVGVTGDAVSALTITGGGIYVTENNVVSVITAVNSVGIKGMTFRLSAAASKFDGSCVAYGISVSASTAGQTIEVLIPEVTQ